MKKNPVLLATVILLMTGTASPGHWVDSTAWIPSHGGSAVCIATGPGQSLFLTADHVAFQATAKRFQVRCPVTGPTAHRTVGIRVVARDYRRDLALVEVAFGPLPYACPVVAKSKLTIGSMCYSAGHDGNKLQRTVEIVTVRAVRSFSARGRHYTAVITQPHNRPGRSGGGLFRVDSPQLVGIVTMWMRDGRGRYYGVYTSAAEISQFLRGVRHPLLRERNYRRITDRPSSPLVGPKMPDQKNWFRQRPNT